MAQAVGKSAPHPARAPQGAKEITARGNSTLRLLIHEPAKERSELAAHPAEFRELLLFRALHSGGVIEAPMDALRGGGKDGATLLGVVADGNHVIEILPHELIHGFRPLARNIDPDFMHGGNGFRAHVAGFCAGARDLERSASIVPKQSFRHLASR